VCGSRRGDEDGSVTVCRTGGARFVCGSETHGGGGLEVDGMKGMRGGGRGGEIETVALAVAHRAEAEWL
jgi:hypothetical protein